MRFRDRDLEYEEYCLGDEAGVLIPSQVHGEGPAKNLQLVWFSEEKRRI